MFSLSKKRAIASLFTALVIAPTLFYLPIVPGFGPNTANAGILKWLISGDARDLDLTGFSCFTVDIKTCIAGIFEVIFVDVSKFIFSFAGNIFDTLIAFSLDSTITKNQTFVETGWIICRDIANTFFIFILLYIAIMTILQVGVGRNTKELLATLIVVALLLNFSMFITRFVIDVGNVFALEFYSAISAGPATYVSLGTNNIQPKNISGGFIAFLALDRLVGPSAIINPSTNLGATIFLFFLVGIFYLVATFVFFSAAFLFLGRVVAFWILMILSPLAFFSFILPNTKSMVWAPWLKQLISQTIFAPIFLFFIYLSIILMQTIRTNPLFTMGSGTWPGSVGFLQPALILFMQFFVLMGLMLYGLKFAKDSSGVIGGTMSKIGGTAVLGGAAFALRNTVGRATNYAMQNAQWAKDLQTSAAGRFATKWALEPMRTGSWDARRAPGVGAALGATGVSLGTAGAPGGIAKTAAEQAAKYKSTYDSLKGQPGKQASFLKSFDSITGRAHAETIWRNISVREQQEMIKNAPDKKTKDFLTGLNETVAREYAKSPAMIKAREKEAKTFEAEEAHKARVEALGKVTDGKVAGGLLGQYDAAAMKLSSAKTPEELEAAKKEVADIKKKIYEESIGPMNKGQIADLDGAVLSHKAVAEQLSEKELQAIARSSTSKLTKTQEDAMRKHIEDGGRDDAKNYFAGSPKENSNRKATKEPGPRIVPASGDLAKDIEKARIEARERVEAEQRALRDRIAKEPKGAAADTTSHTDKKPVV